jgi:hypothetical protein
MKEIYDNIRFARGDRSGMQGDGKPGPGQYDADTNKLKGKVSFTMG